MADVPANPDSGAAGTEYQTIEGLRRFGHDVEAIWSNGLPHRIRHGNLHYLLELPLAYRHQMQILFKTKSYDVVHINQPHGYLAAKALSHLNRIVFIHRSHGFEQRAERDLKRWQKVYDQDHRSGWRRAVSKVMSYALTFRNKAIAQYSDGHIVSASQCRDFLHQEMGVALERIVVIPQAPPSLYSELPALQMSSSRLRRILYVGQFAFFKAPMIVAKVMNKLAGLYRELEFTWVCSKVHHRQVKELLTEETAQRISLYDWMPQDKLIDVYDQHGIFLFPSFFEGFGKVFLEAMSRGLCVVAADNGGAHDVIKHGVNGMLAPTGSIETMVKHCEELINHPSIAASISQAAAKNARNYTWDRVAAETLAFYQDRLAAKAYRLHKSSIGSTDSDL